MSAVDAEWSWLKRSRHGGRVKRSHTVVCIHQQDNAAHSHGAMAIAQIILSEFGESDFNKLVVLQYLMMHDIAEGYTGDMPANVKVDNPALREAMNEAELVWTKAHIPSWHNPVPGMSTHLMNIAKMADRLDLLMYSLEEVSLGNRHETLLDMLINITRYAGEFNEVLQSKFAEKVINEAHATISAVLARRI